ncbi:glycosyltransferase family 2 protein [Cellulomonas sp.]|uniref:glycosyltransferase family 2 protein n=1 Tax=Cellulomonas sp. TaxID=40001 RepID=UPI003BACF03C
MSSRDGSAGRVLERTCVVLLNWHAEPDTVEFIRSLVPDFGQDQIIVCDNESTGSLRLALASADLGMVTVLEHDENRGYAAGLNPGLRAAVERGFDYQLLLNTDLVYTPDVLRPLFEDVAARGLRGIASPVVLNSDGTLQSAGCALRPLTLRIDELAGIHGEPFDFLTWACVLVDSESLAGVGYLDEHYFMYWEDVDIAARIQNLGGELRLVTGARITHARSASHARAGAKIWRYQAMGSARYARTRGGTFLFGLAIRTVSRIAKRLVRGEFQGAWNVVLGTTDGLTFRR